MKYKLDFSHPLQARKWLKLLEPHKRFGFLIKRDKVLPQSLLGFSFSSNRLGLRGPCNQKAGIVCMGTSYAMGFSVNNGNNWWELMGSDSDNILNLGLPVGIAEWLELAKLYYNGKRDTLLLLYHANWYSHEEQYSRWRQTRQRVHEFFRWKTTLTDCTLLSLRTSIGLRNQAKKYLFSSHDGLVYRFDLSYCTSNNQIPIDSLIELRNFAMQFSRTIVINLPCKEDLISEGNLKLDLCNNLRTNHSAKWNGMISIFSGIPNITIHNWKPSSLQCYLPFDTHLSTKGNQELADIIKTLLNRQV